MSKAPTVWLHPVFNAYYYGFFVEGLRTVLPGARITFDAKPFKGWIGPRDGSACIIDGEPDLRLYFSADDHPDVHRRELRWADAYGLVNLHWPLVPSRQRHKIAALGPSFGVAAWGPWAASATALRVLWKGRRELPAKACVPQTRSFWDQWHDRLPLSCYQPRQSDRDHVFFVSWLWAKHDGDEVNRMRRRFIASCRDRPDLHFEGGFAPRRRGSPPGYEALMAGRRYPLDEYLDRTARSAFVFNTPAVHDCLGWKLGEYLALGKAIITTPIRRELPSPLVHGTHVHVVDGSEVQLDEAITVLRQDLPYRRHLEAGARAYWEQHLTPATVVGRLIGIATTNTTSRDPKTLHPAPDWRRDPIVAPSVVAGPVATDTRP